MYPLLHVVSAFRGQLVFPIFIFDLEAVFLFVKVLQDVDLGVAQHDQVEILLLYEMVKQGR